MKNIEIERKFLVDGDFKSMALTSYNICQGYICRNGRTVRVRIRDNQGYLTIKGPSTDGISRFEWEKEIPLNEAKDLMLLCQGGIIDKRRWIIPYLGHTFEVDEFYGDNEGLVLAEVELADANEYFDKPIWLGKEVTGNKLYYNSHLIDEPYCKWQQSEK